MTKPLITRNLWAPIVRTKGGHEWINWHYVRTTLRQAKADYSKGMPTNHRAHWRSQVRFVKVTIQEVGKS